MKVVVDAETDKVLGAAIFGVGGDEVVHEILDIMSAGALTPRWHAPCTSTRPSASCCRRRFRR
jgi:pyruvate/2-oxoglutarate dehydrogenase complex dihydrolipoamide dehydrogenase (E3) component